MYLKLEKYVVYVVYFIAHEIGGLAQSLHQSICNSSICLPEMRICFEIARLD